MAGKCHRGAGHTFRVGAKTNLMESAMKRFWLLFACVASAAVLPAGLNAYPIVSTSTLPPHPIASYSYDRLLPLEGGQNFRELGGYPTEDGRHVRWGLLFRSGSMYRLTPKDFNYLQKIGLRTVVDLRSRQERAAEPVNWPVESKPVVHSTDYDFSVLGKHMADVKSVEPGELSAQMIEMYPSILVEMKGQYRQLFANLLAGDAPLAFNCSAGRDRTGIAAALILSALGVPRETVIQDYLLTNRYYDPARTGPAAQTWGDIPPAVSDVMKSSARPSIERVFGVIDTHTGGMAGYFRDELGLDNSDIKRLRHMYTE